MTRSSKLRYDCATALSLGARDRQEDCLVADFAIGAPIGIAVLADGMGGHHGGEVASALIVSDVFSQLKKWQGPLSKKPGKLPERLRETVELANEALLQTMRTKPDLRGMGATVVACVVVSGSLYWVSVGDSLLYLYRDGKLKRLNQDHSMAPRIDAMVAAGQLAHDEGVNHPDRNSLTSAITGKAIPQVDCPNVPFAIDESDVVIMASDGLQTLSEEELVAVIEEQRNASGPQIAEALIKAVESREEPKQDNTSVAVLKVNSASGVAEKNPLRLSGADTANSSSDSDTAIIAAISPDIEEASDLLNQAIAL